MFESILAAKKVSKTRLLGTLNENGGTFSDADRDAMCWSV
jgi:hypothetical protein